MRAGALGWHGEQDDEENPDAETASGATGHMIWALAEKDGQTTVTWSYDAGGYMRGGLDKIAPIVDQVLGQQQDRLKAYLETGKAG